MEQTFNQMKANLINTPQGVIAVTNTRPKEGDWVYDYGVCSIYINGDTSIDNDGFKVIIASTFGIGKPMKMKINNVIISLVGVTLDDVDFSKPYEYTETENSIVIKL